MTIDPAKLSNLSNTFSTGGGGGGGTHFFDGPHQRQHCRDLRLCPAQPGSGHGLPGLAFSDCGGIRCGWPAGYYGGGSGIGDPPCKTQKHGRSVPENQG